LSAGPHFIQAHGHCRKYPTVVLEKAKNGMWTAAVREENGTSSYLHSRYDPRSEAVRWASAQQRSLEMVPDRIVVYGAGCGHHLEALLEQTAGSETQVEVWETNVQAFALMDQNDVFRDLYQNPRLTFVVSDDMRVFSERMEEWEALDVHVFVHEPSLRAVPEELQEFKRLLQDYQVRHNSVIAFTDQLDVNFQNNTQQTWSSLSKFRGMLPVPVILASAGPSLAKNISLLPKASRHCMIGAVGTAVRPLLSQGVVPDFVVMTDPKQGMLQQLDGWETAEIALFFLSTLYHGVVERYRGPKFILYQNGYTPAEREASRRSEPLVETGGSVSTTLFSVARILGCQPICLVGQDLAYTEGQSHVKGTPLYQRWEHEMKGEQVLSFDGNGTVMAPRNLLLYKKWFEEQARNADTVFYNATEGGAYIEGFTHLTLEHFLDRVRSIDVTEVRKKFHGMVQTAYTETSGRGNI
jgi:hypothetical protein